jgi:hypothetical protein
MADPKYRFYSVPKTDPIQEVGFVNALNGEAETAKFSDGELVTSEPGIVGGLLGVIGDGHPNLRAEPVAEAKSSKKGA